MRRQSEYRTRTMVVILVVTFVGLLGQVCSLPAAVAAEVELTEKKEESLASLSRRLSEGVNKLRALEIQEKDGGDCEDGDACTGVAVVTGSSGTIKSPGFKDHHYPNDAFCQWRIKAPAGHALMISADIAVEYGVNCMYDNLTFYNGPSNSSPVIGTFCGVKTITNTSTSNEVFIVFKSDQSVNTGGFVINWAIVTLAATNPCASGNIESLTDPSGTIRSPDYFKGEYPNNSTCQWKITAPVGKAVYLEVVKMDIEHEPSCSYDNVSFYDGSSTTAPLLKLVCGTKTATPLTSANSMFIRFYSDATVHTGGFMLAWKFVDQAAEGTHVDPCLPGHVAELSTVTGAVNSPGFDKGSYPENSQCRWRITSPPSSTITVTIKDVNIQPSHDCACDSLTFFDGDDGSAKQLGKFCGKQLGTVTSTGPNMFVAFVADDSQSTGRFIFEWSFLGKTSKRAEEISDVDAGNLAKVAEMEDKELTVEIRELLHGIDDKK